MSERSPFDPDPSDKPMGRLKRNPSRKRLEGFRKWEHETPRTEKEQKIGGVLERLVDYLGVAGRLREQRVLEIWPGVVGDKIAGVAKAKAIKDGILTVEVVNPSWRNELTYLTPEILAKLNHSLGYSLVKRLKFC